MELKGAPIGFARFSAYEMVPPTVFLDVPVLPTTEVRRTLNNGGPALEEWDDQVELRHGRFGFPMPSLPQPLPGRLPVLDGSFIWGGYVERHFGHLVCEYTTRLLPSLHERPNDTVLFAMWPGGAPEDVPRAFWSVLDWYGLPRERVKIIDRPVVVRKLWMTPQPEQLHGPGPSSRYLELLGANAAARGLAPEHSDVIYVSRSALMEKNLASWVGESYLVERLQSLGIRVFEPERHSLPKQLSVYAGAKSLVFAEGSAVHGRQLLGYCNQDIIVLSRRPNSRIAIHNLLPRCRSVVYAEVTKGLIRMVFHDGSHDLPRALAVYREDNLFRIFEALGVPLREVWHPASFLERCRAEVLMWLQNQFNRVRQQNANFDWDKSISCVRSDLRRQGFDFVFPEANFWLQRKTLNRD